MPKTSCLKASILRRKRLTIDGAVQGVGLRPFVARSAQKFGLSGWVQNSPGGVVVEIEGSLSALESFRQALNAGLPPQAKILTCRSEDIAPQNAQSFDIRQSNQTGDISAIMLPDLAVCDDCLSEMRNENDRRHDYPFTNCTNCGPRFSIITDLPYDRPSTSMENFIMCDACRAEYEDPTDRRYHAQPIACPDCGPQLALWDITGQGLATHNDALTQAADMIRAGKILAVKGVGGFHLMADATQEEAIEKLRTRKHRPRKPLAIMATLDQAKRYCYINAAEERVLTSSAAPIVLLRRKDDTKITKNIAPNNPYLGVMLPYTPLHHLLLDKSGVPLIATSGNHANEPICIDEHDALDHLCGIADAFLIHDRPIVGRCDDSIVQIVQNQPVILRRARGYAPLPIMLPRKVDEPLLATGGHLKNTVALAVQDKLFLSPHIGDLQTPLAAQAHQESIDLLTKTYRCTPKKVACDKHPDYRSTQMAEATYEAPLKIQHHHAHALSCLLDNDLSPPCLAVTWDGTGYGEDGTIWGGEFLHLTKNGVTRIGHLRPFALPGGEAAIREPKRIAVWLEYEMGIIPDDPVMAIMLEKRLGCPTTTSAGRLFDGVSSLLGLCEESSFEGEASMALQFCAMQADEDTPPYTIPITDGVVDWRPMLQNILHDFIHKCPKPDIAAAFHKALAVAIKDMALASGEQNILLTGGCFQNNLLLELTINQLCHAGLTPYWHHDIPPNDGGIAAGQIMGIMLGRN